MRQALTEQCETKQKQDKMMKTKTLVATVALAGAVLAGTSTAKANATLELISGSATAFGTVSGDDAVYVGSVGGWSVNVASGLADSLNVSLSDSSHGTPTAGLEIIYISGTYSFGGGYTFGASDPGLNTLNGTAQGFYSATAPALGGPYGTALAGSPFSLPAIVAASPQLTGSLVGNDYITEILTFGNPAAGSLTGISQHVQGQISFQGSGSVVPDGGLTLGMIGSVMVGLAGLRSKFSKRS
jgi:hypothetical protein